MRRTASGNKPKLTFLLSNYVVFNLFDLPARFQWAHSATSHGKGLVDGIGGRAKSLVRQAVMSKKMT